MNWFWRKKKPVDLATQYMEEGQCLAAQDKFEEAIERMQAALGVNPDYRPARLSLGALLVELRRLDEALPHFHHVIKLDPQDAEPYVQLGEAYWREGKRDWAVAQFRQALLRVPEHEHARARLREASAEQVAFSLEHGMSRRDHQAWALAEYKQMKGVLKKQRSLGGRIRRFFTGR